MALHGRCWTFSEDHRRATFGFHTWRCIFTDSFRSSGCTTNNSPDLWRHWRLVILHPRHATRTVESNGRDTCISTSSTPIAGDHSDVHQCSWSFVDELWCKDIALSLWDWNETNERSNDTGHNKRKVAEEKWYFWRELEALSLAIWRLSSTGCPCGICSTRARHRVRKSWFLWPESSWRSWNNVVHGSGRLSNRSKSLAYRHVVISACIGGVHQRRKHLPTHASQTFWQARIDRHALINAWILCYFCH